MKMMKKAGFTLVELIVVITILAILGTIAFISLQGNTQEAKNSKVSSDLRTLATAVETSVTGDDSFSLNDLTDGTGSGTAVATVETMGDVTLADARVTLLVGAIDFRALRQNGDNFKDPEGRPYVAAYVTDSQESRNTFYQLVGQTKETNGNYKAIVQGNYIQLTSTGAAGLVTTTTGTEGTTSGANSGDEGVINGEGLGNSDSTLGLY